MKIALVVVWFGKLPSYFDFWELTCSKNQDIDFYVYTDDKGMVRSKYKNVKISYLSIEDFKTKASTKIGIPVVINNGYKLCDYKVSYGDIFEEDLKGYGYWGYCDIDLAFGNILNFIREQLEAKPEMINEMGHFCLYKNNAKMRKLYQEKGASWNYKTVYSDPDHYAFDEFSGMCKIAKENNIKVAAQNNYVDFDRKKSRQVNVIGDNYNSQCFLWDNGKAIQLGKTENREVMYIHFQGRKPLFNKEKSQIYQINNSEITPIRSYDEAIFCQKSELKDRKDQIVYYAQKMKDFIKTPSESKKRWIRRKVCEITKK